MSNSNGAESTVTLSVPLIPPSKHDGTEMELTVLPAARAAVGANAESTSIAAAESQPAVRRSPPRRRAETDRAFMVRVPEL